uniref:Uncharacterized protein n=1 Tax=Acrobeloides nanus TaxID=290746 RepID=A0A914CT16_9BILA
MSSKIDALAASIPKTFADAVKNNITSNKVIETREEQVLLTQEAIREEEGRPIRDKRCVVKNIPADADPNDILSAICIQAQLSTNDVTMTALGKSKPTIAYLISTTSKENATKIIKSISHLRHNSPDRYKTMSARPDYSATELSVFRKLWAEAFSRNNLANKMLWTVRDLKMMELKIPLDWKKKETQSSNSNSVS